MLDPEAGGDGQAPAARLVQDHLGLVGAPGAQGIGAGGREALAAAAMDEPFDLLVTDVVMPEMSGPELAVKLRVQQPLLPVLYMSGYTDDVLSAHELSQDATAFLRKPFGNAELIAATRELLDARPRAPIRRATVDSSA